MNNIKNTIWNKRIPSIIGVMFLTLSIGTIGWLSSNAVLFGTKAAAANIPKNVRITNISDSSFTVSYLTDDQVTGTLNYGKDQAINQVAFDDRDDGQPAAHSVHYFNVKNLDASSKYFFTITSGSEIFSNNKIPYDVITTTKSEFLPEEFLINGKIGLDDGSTPKEAVVYVSVKDSQVLSALTNTNGEYDFDLSMIVDLLPDTVLNLEVFDPTRQSKVSLLVNQGNPVPLVILSKNYDFITGNEPLPVVPTASESGIIAFPVNEGQQEAKPQILSPEKNEELKDQQPVFTGKAVPNTEVEIIIESENPITTTVKASPNGNWQYRPDTKLAPGDHTITIKTTDQSGIVRTITQSFVVFAEGSQFTEPSVSPSASPTIAPTVKVTQAPTLTPTATQAPTLTPTKVSPTAVTTVPVPVTGNTTLIVTIIGTIAAIGAGALLFFLTAL